MPTQKTTSDMLPPADFPLLGPWIGELVQDNTYICQFIAGSEPGEFYQQPLTWPREMPIHGLFQAHLANNTAQRCTFSPSATRAGVYYQQLYHEGWQRTLCSCPAGLKGHHKHRCHHLNTLRDHLLAERASLGEWSSQAHTLVGERLAALEKLLNNTGSATEQPIVRITIQPGGLSIRWDE